MPHFSGVSGTPQGVCSREQALANADAILTCSSSGAPALKDGAEILLIASTLPLYYLVRGITTTSTHIDDAVSRGVDIIRIEKNLGIFWEVAAAELDPLLRLAGQVPQRLLPLRPPADHRRAGRLDVLLAQAAVPADAQRLPPLRRDRADLLRELPDGAAAPPARTSWLRFRRHHPPAVQDRAARTRRPGS